MTVPTPQNPPPADAGSVAPATPPGPQGEVIELQKEDAYWIKAFISEPNRRIRVLDYRVQDGRAMCEALEAEAKQRGLDKVFLKARAGDSAALLDGGFTQEAVIRGFFDGVDAVVVSLFLSEERRQTSASPEELLALEKLKTPPAAVQTYELPTGYRSALARPEDAPALAALYKEVFASYPFPIFDPDYLVHTMRTNIVYRLVWDESGQLVAAASGETVPELANAEMTDFATLPSQRGKRLALYILQELEKDMAARNIPNLYTLARSCQIGMNKVFHHLGYVYTGTLTKNCHIGGKFEDMICWCKRLG